MTTSGRSALDDPRSSFHVDELAIEVYVNLITGFHTDVYRIIDAPAHLDPIGSTVQAGDTISVSGQGFGAAERARIVFDGVRIAATTAGPTGTVQKKVAIPRATSPGAHILSASGATSDWRATTIMTVVGG